MVFYKFSKVKGRKYLQIAKSIRNQNGSTNEVLYHLGTAEKLLTKLEAMKNEQVNMEKRG